MLVPSMSSSMKLQPHLAQLRRKAMGAEGKDKVLVSWEVERPNDLEFYRIPFSIPWSERDSDKRRSENQWEFE